jgi:hypothetical protein
MEDIEMNTTPSGTRRRFSDLSRNLLRTITAAGLMLTGTLAVVSIQAAPAHATSTVGGTITRSEVISRAVFWYNERSSLSYDETRTTLYPDPQGTRYGADCSGYVSMAWHVNPGSSGGYNTSSLKDSSVSSPISSFSALLPGDLLDDTVAPEHHAILFDAWESDHVHFSYYSFGSYPISHVTHASQADANWAGHPSGHYTFWRYNKIIDDTASVYEAALQTNTNDLWSLGSAALKDWATGMMPGTSPSITRLSTGGYEMALQVNTGDLWTLGDAGAKNWGAGMAPGTSPSITATPGGGYEVAIQTNTGDLWTLGSLENKDWGAGMAPGTSPSITALPGGGYEVAIQTNTNDLWTLGAGGNKDWQTGMMPGTSPSIIATTGQNYEVALQVNTGDLWTLGSLENKDWGAGMAPGTSPSITALPGGGYEVAIQTNTNDLWTLGAGGNKDWQTGMMPGTSPSIIAATGQNYEVALQVNTGDLWTLGALEYKNWGAGMAPNTSPSIA